MVLTSILASFTRFPLASKYVASPKLCFPLPSGLNTKLKRFCFLDSKPAPTNANYLQGILKTNFGENWKTWKRTPQSAGHMSFPHSIGDQPGDVFWIFDDLNFSVGQKHQQCWWHLCLRPELLQHQDYDHWKELQLVWGLLTQPALLRLDAPRVQ